MAVSLIPRGSTYIRGLLGAAAAGATGAAGEYTRHRYGEGAARIAKAAVETIGANDFDVLTAPESIEVWSVVESMSIIGKLPGLRIVPLNVRTVLMAEGFTAYWSGRGKLKPLSKMSLTGGTLTPLKVAVIVAITKEFAKSANAAAESRFRTDMLRAISEALDAAIIDPANAGIADEMPASITNGVSAIASSDSPTADLAALFDGFAGDLTTSALVTDPMTAALLALARDAQGSFLFPDAGPRGGTVAGIPLITSRASPRDSSGGQLALVDASGVAYGAEGVRTTASESATLEMVDETTDGATSLVSMFQTDSVALLSESRVNWTVARPGSIRLVTGTSYPVEVA